MVGISGGNHPSISSDFIHELNTEPHHKSKICTVDDWMLGMVHHGEQDPNGYQLWNNSSYRGVLFGNVRNREKIHNRIDELPEEILKNPNIVSELEGSFAIGITDGSKLVIASDRLSSIPIYYCKIGEKILFSSRVSSLTPYIKNPTVDLGAVAEMVGSDVVRADKTLLNEIKAIPPGSYLSFSKGSYNINRYYWLDFKQKDAEYINKLYESFESTIRADLNNIPEENKVGAMLSGGLDSRLLVGILQKHRDDIITFTYDANPAGGVNTRLASEVANTLNVKNTAVPHSPEDYISNMENVVDLLDGRMSWKSTHALNFNLNCINNKTDIIIRNQGQGELFGDKLTKRELKRAQNGEVVETIVDLLYDSWEDLQSEIFSEKFEYDLEEELYDRIERMPHIKSRNVFLELYLQEFYINRNYRPIEYREKVGLRRPLVDSSILNLSASMPTSLYPRAENGFLDIFGDAVSTPKLKLIRILNGGLESIPYDRTGISPKYPLDIHTSKLAIDRIINFTRRKLGSEISEQKHLTARWYRNNDDLQDKINKYLNDAKKRDFFDESKLEELRDQHLAKKENNISEIAAITTVEIWLQEHIDRHEQIE